MSHNLTLVLGTLEFVAKGKKGVENATIYQERLDVFEQCQAIVRHASINLFCQEEDAAAVTVRDIAALFDPHIEALKLKLKVPYCLMVLGPDPDKVEALKSVLEAEGIRPPLTNHGQKLMDHWLLPVSYDKGCRVQDLLQEAGISSSLLKNTDASG